MFILSALITPVRNPVVSEFGTGWNYVNSGVSSFINIGYMIAIVVFVFIFIIGAFQWITSGSDKNKLAEAKGKITHAIVGLLILLLVFLITQLVNWILGINIGFLNRSGVDPLCSEHCSETYGNFGYCDPPGDPPAPGDCENDFSTDCFNNTMDCYCCDSDYGGNSIAPVTVAINPITPTPLLTGEQDSCEIAGGEWVLFGDGCADICGMGPGCLMVQTWGCDCGPTMCWDGMNCQISVVPTPTNIPIGGMISTPTPTIIPTPIIIPTATPTRIPTATPTRIPTATPTRIPTATPTRIPTATPTRIPTATPTRIPTATPTRIPTATPTRIPTATPTPFGGTCYCDLGVVLGNNCILPYQAQCVGQFGCTCVLPAPTTTSVPVVPSPSSPPGFCIDTDSGLDIFTFGVVSENILIPGIIQDHPDSCFVNTLSEYACSGDGLPGSATVRCSLYGGAICLRGECCYDYGASCTNLGDCCSPYVCSAGRCQPPSNILLNEASGKSCTNLCWDSGFRSGSYCTSIGTNATADNGAAIIYDCSSTNVYSCDSPMLLHRTTVECGGYNPYWTYCNCVPNASVD